MKNYSVKHVFMVLMLLATRLPAQVLQHRAISCDLLALSRNGMQLGYKIMQGPLTAFEFQFEYNKHSIPADVEVFNGHWFKNYAEEKMDTLIKATNVLIGSSGWQYFDEERPLAAVPTYVPQSTIQVAALYRKSFQKTDSPWSVFIQAGVFVSLHRYFENRESLIVTQRAKDSWEFINAQGQERKVQYNLNQYLQNRSIRLKNDWRAGIAYQLGLARRLGEHFFIEGRLDLGLHIGPPPYEEPTAPLLARRLITKPAFLVGWAF